MSPNIKSGLCQPTSADPEELLLMEWFNRVEKRRLMSHPLNRKQSDISSLRLTALLKAGDEATLLPAPVCVAGISVTMEPHSHHEGNDVPGEADIASQHDFLSFPACA